jgi:hypothetical protein
VLFAALHESGFGRFRSLTVKDNQLDFEGDVVGCLCSLRAYMALDGVSWVRSGLVEIAVGRRTHRIQGDCSRVAGYDRVISRLGQITDIPICDLRLGPLA